MVELQFKKYQGTGNDFIMIDGIRQSLRLNPEQIQHLCHRKLGIGADGVIILERDDSSDFYVNYYNSDGSQSFCGNGSRCSVAFSRAVGIISANTCTFRAIDGMHTGELLADGTVKVSMGDVSGMEHLSQGKFLNTGSPHVVTQCNALKDLDIIKAAHDIRYNERFKEKGTNVNFVSEQDGLISIRTYERGVEDETLSCGTGVTAVALALAEEEGFHLREIKTEGGLLRVAFKKEKSEFTHVFLMGAAQEVFFGEIQL
ncbi:MAG: diaminopimelate epimerase [Flavobacteriales bacterium]